LCIGPSEGDAAQIIKEYQLGVCFNYDEIKPIQNTLQKLLDGGKISYQKWNSDFQNHPFSRYTLTEKLLQLIE
jgi:hypothetical protein